MSNNMTVQWVIANGIIMQEEKMNCINKFVSSIPSGRLWTPTEEKEMKISMDKEYTLGGREVVVICNDALGYFPVRGYFKDNGRAFSADADGSVRNESFRIKNKMLCLKEVKRDGDMTIKLGNGYRFRDGTDVVICCNDKPGKYPVLGYETKAGEIFQRTREGKVGECGNPNLDVVEKTVRPFTLQEAFEHLRRKVKTKAVDDFTLIGIEIGTDRGFVRLSREQDCFCVSLPRFAESYHFEDGSPCGVVE